MRHETFQVMQIERANPFVIENALLFVERMLQSDITPRESLLKCYFQPEFDRYV